MALFNMFRKRSASVDDDAEDQSLEALSAKVITHPRVEELPGPDGVPARHLTSESLRYLRGDFNVDELLKGIDVSDSNEGEPLNFSDLDTAFESAAEPETSGQTETIQEREDLLLRRLSETLQENKQLQEQLDEISGKARIMQGNLLRYRTHFEITHEACLFTSADLLIIKEANAAAAHLLSKTKAQLSGTPLTLFVEPDDRAKLRTFVLSLLSDNNAAMRLNFLGGGDRQVPLLLTGALVRDDDRVYGVVINATPMDD